MDNKRKYSSRPERHIEFDGRVDVLRRRNRELDMASPESV